MAGGRYSTIEDAALVTRGERIEWIGPRAELPAEDYPEAVDLGGATVVASASKTF